MKIKADDIHDDEDTDDLVQDQDDAHTDPEDDDEEDDSTAADEGDADDEDQDEQQDDDEVIVTIGDESPSSEEAPKEPTAPWVKELRKTNRELMRWKREREERDRAATAATETKPVVAKKPTLADEDIDYDEEKFERRLTEWHDSKRKVEEAEKAAKAQKEADNAAWQAERNAFAAEKAALASDWEEVDEVVENALSVTQQGIIVLGIKRRADMFRALGTNPTELKRLAAITDPIKFAVAAAKLEEKLKVTQRQKSAPAPERTVSGTARLSSNSDSKLERLRAEADKTGDMTKVIAYKRQLRAAQK